MIRKLLCGHLLLLILNALVGFRADAAEPAVPLVEPSELTRRTDLIGRMVSVDDRVARFQWHNDREDSIPDRPYDEIYLKRTPVIFRLPPRLRFETAPRAAAVRIEGVLKREAGQWFCDVVAIDLLPSDLERLERAAAALDPRDVERRLGWARWAERRARAFGDAKDSASLLERARRLEAEAIQIEAESPSADPPRHWLELARRARQREIPEPEPGALAHRALAARLAAAASVPDLQTLVKEIEEFWPASTAPTVGSVDLDSWVAPYARDPATTYRIAPEPVRAALDHRLWSDATQRLVERRMAAEPEHAFDLAQAAATALRDRPAGRQATARAGPEGSHARPGRAASGRRRRAGAGLSRYPPPAGGGARAAPPVARRPAQPSAQRDRCRGARHPGPAIRRAAGRAARPRWRCSRTPGGSIRSRGKWPTPSGASNYRKVNDQWIESPRSSGDAATDPGAGTTPGAARTSDGRSAG